ncbi:MAG: HDIG domain-containing protein [Clostridia bacterium]|nr:HDIG domain-containing protein [Clostridia bacterium]
MILAAFLIILGLLFCVCTPRKYDLRVGSISHVTVDATKDVVDKVTTEEKQNAAAEQVVPNLHFKQGVKEEVLASLSGAFQELRAIQQYGLMLRTSRDGELIADRPFSEEEIEYAFSMIDILELNRTQLEIILRSDTDEFEKMVTTVTKAVENSLNASTIREGQVNQAISNIQQNVGYSLDISFTQIIVPTVLRTCIKPNMISDPEETEEARQKARDAVEPIVFLQGQNIIREGDRITLSQIEMLRSLGMLNENSYDYSIYYGASIIVVISMVILLMMLRLLLKDLLTEIRRLAVILIILVLCVGFASLATLLPSIYVIPISLGAILGTVLIGYRAGLVLIVPLTLLFAAITSCSSSTTFYDVVVIMANTLSCGVATVWFLKGRPQRIRVLLSGMLAAVVNIVMIAGIKLLTSAETLNMIQTGVWTVAGSLLSGTLAVALQPAFETLFHLATPSRLLEITNPNHPLMKRLMIEAPGTYHHSIIVANLAEAAADKIGANAYLARAGAYYHDIGKLKRPGYFSENQHGSNPHEKTDPYISAAILTSHTKDGALMAQKDHLPPEVQDIILQHHGVTPVMFFYHKALQLSDGKHVDINDFRYSGPKPRTREASIVMMADSIEAAVRSMKDPTPKAIDQYIERLIRGKLEDGQLSECPLSLHDIDEICNAFSGILKGVYHERIEYPKVEKYAVQPGTKTNVPAAESEPAQSSVKNTKAEPADEEKNDPEKTAVTSEETDEENQTGRHTGREAESAD